MKRRAAKHISLVFLVLFTCTFSFRNAVAATGNFSRSPIELFKAVEKRGNDCVPEDTGLFENETAEDEAEDEAAACFDQLPCLAGNTFLFDHTNTTDRVISHLVPYIQSDVRHHLYLLVRRFRI